MIDALDKQTRALPLEPAKRGRGRPSTGKAMTPAEKQRAYRQRQKAAAGNVTENTDTKQALEELRDYAVKLAEEMFALEKENRRLKAELSSRGAVTKKRAHRDDKPLESINDWHRKMKARLAEGVDSIDALWRFVGNVEVTLEQHGLTVAK